MGRKHCNTEGNAEGGGRDEGGAEMREWREGGSN